MIKITVLYGQPEDTDAFEDYYANTHMPIAGKMEGLERLELTRFGPNPDGSPAAYHRMAEMYFATEDQAHTTLSSPEGKAAVDDLSNFATGGVTMLSGQIAE